MALCVDLSSAPGGAVAAAPVAAPPLLQAQAGRQDGRGVRHLAGEDALNS